MPVKDADPRAEELDAGFAAAMTGPAKPREPAPPPPVDPEAPHGRGEDGKPLAPFGYTKEGHVRKSAGGRKAKEAKDDQARITDDQPPAAAAATAPLTGTVAEPRDYSAPLMDAAEAAWFGGSVLAKVGPKLPVVGRLIPGQKLAATMAVFDSERPRLAAALNLAAQHDAKARRLAERLSSSDATWSLTCMFMVAPFAITTAAVWQGEQALADRELPALEVMVKANEAAMDRMFAKISQQIEAAQAQAAEQAAEQMAAAAAQNGQGGDGDSGGA
jgi:hypothetical protein